MTATIRFAIALTSTLLALLASPAARSQAPARLTYVGVLEQEGQPVTGTVSAIFDLYDAADGGQLLWSETFSALVVDRGEFSVELGVTTPFVLGDFSGQPLWLSLVINGEALLPRTSITSVPYALRAAGCGESAALAGFNPADYSTTAQIQSNLAGDHTIQVNWANLINVPSDISTGNPIDEAQVDQWTANNGFLTGSGSAGAIARYTGAQTLQSSTISESNGNVGISAVASERLEVGGNIRLAGTSPTYRVVNAAEPVNPDDLATKAYVDRLSQKLWVYQADGATPIGPFLGVDSTLDVTCAGILYSDGNGNVQHVGDDGCATIGTNVYYTDAACSGTHYAYSGSEGSWTGWNRSGAARVAVIGSQLCSGGNYQDFWRVNNDGSCASTATNIYNCYMHYLNNEKARLCGVGGKCKVR